MGTNISQESATSAFTVEDGVLKLLQNVCNNAKFASGFIQKERSLKE
jgi:hypothetical protein